MENSALVKSADKIGKVSEASLKEYVDKMEILAASINEVMLKKVDILELIGGEENILRMKENHGNHLQFIAAILQTPHSKTLVDTLLWVFRVFMIRGFTSNYWEVQINTFTQHLKENLSEKAFFEISSIYNWIYINIPNFAMAANENWEDSKRIANE